MSDSENVESTKKTRTTVVGKRANLTALEKDEVPAKRGRGRPKGTMKKNSNVNSKKNVVMKKRNAAKERGRPAKKIEDSTEDDTEDDETENNESDE